MSDQEFRARWQWYQEHSVPCGPYGTALDAGTMWPDREYFIALVSGNGRNQAEARSLESPESPENNIIFQAPDGHTVNMGNPTVIQTDARRALGREILSDPKNI